MTTSPVSTSSAHLDLASQVPINPSSTTSRVVLNNPLLRVVHFTFDAGELLTEHASPRAVVVMLVEGEMRFTVHGEEHTLQAGDIVYLAPGDRHALVALTPCRMTLVLVDTEADVARADTVDKVDAADAAPQAR